jgi:hypothetical protein
MPKIEIENGVGLYYEIEGQGEAVVLIQGLDRDCYGRWHREGRSLLATRWLPMMREVPENLTPPKVLYLHTDGR